ncbi:hypothetical protein B5M09_004284 [Aphanomyces astaci]|uniref:Ornithine aminotransferase n=1 Tax=Aphanomyces astaci TaxID=112090 RepID=A0A3R7WWP4_APHAT|nr:hypothetical protein B5M09_004284 [Aphanomyces astaci]
MSLTSSKTIYKAGFGPLMSGVFVMPYPYTLHSPFSDPGGYVAPPPGFLQGLSSLCYEHDILLIADEDVRGVGLMVAVEFDKSVPPGTVSRICQACVEYGMLLLPTR